MKAKEKMNVKGINQFGIKVDISSNGKLKVT